MQIKKIFLETARLNELKEFYYEVLCLPLSSTENQDLVVHAGNSEIIFRQDSGNKHPIYHFAFNIPYNKIEAARLWLKEKINLIWIEDYQSEIAEFTNWKARSLYFFDPAGNILELIGRKEYPTGTENGFGSKDFLSVSEIGIVFSKEEYDNKIAEIMDLMELDYFSRQKPLPGFSAIGDDEGLLIAVFDDRKWYPTNIHSGIYPLEIEIFQKDKLRRLTIS
jgi:hypothetical protein